MAFNKTAEGSSMKRRPMRRRKKVCVFCGKDNVIDYQESTSSCYDAIRLRIDLVIPRVSAFGDVALTRV